MGLTEDTATGLLGLDVLPHSAVSVAGAEIGLARPGPRVAVLAPSGFPVISRFRGKAAPSADVRSCSARGAGLTWTPCATSCPGYVLGHRGHAPQLVSATGWDSPHRATSGPCAPREEDSRPSLPSSP
jgi:hypothetical protein